MRGINFLDQHTQVQVRSSKPPEPPLEIATLKGNLHLPSNSRLPIPDNSAGTVTFQNAVFLDRDGVVVQDVHFLRQPHQLRLLPGVVEALRKLQSRFYIVVVTNQSGIARGFIDEKKLVDIHTELVQRLSDEGATVDGLYYCPHLPGAPVLTYDVTCECRKPKPGMLLQAARDWNIDLTHSFLVGDMPRDVKAAAAAGVKGIITSEVPTGEPGPKMFARDLLDAAHQILANPSH